MQALFQFWEEHLAHSRTMDLATDMPLARQHGEIDSPSIQATSPEIPTLARSMLNATHVHVE